MKLFKDIIPERLLQKELSLDVSSVLCEQVWEAFNDEGIKQVLIFKSNGELLVSTDGNVSNGSWSFIPSNQGVIISSNDGAKMYHPVYLDSAVFALQLDGRQDTLFLINSQSAPLFQKRTNEELGAYFSSKEDELNVEEKRREEQAKRTSEKREEEKLIRQQAINETRPLRLLSVSRILCIVSAGILFLGPLVLMLVDLLLVVVFNYQAIFVPVFDKIDYLLDNGFILAYVPVGVLAVQCHYNYYYLERSVALIKLREKDFLLYYNANRLKIIPVLIRLMGWIFALAGCFICFFRRGSTHFELRWWQSIGIFVGGSLACLFWVWIWSLVARTIEKKLFGIKLPWCICN